jgi:hypothetical protein
MLNELENFYIYEVNYMNGIFNKINNISFTNDKSRSNEIYTKKICDYKIELQPNNSAVCINEFDRKLDVKEIKNEIVEKINKYIKYDYVYFIEVMDKTEYNIYQIIIKIPSYWNSYMKLYDDIEVILVRSLRTGTSVYHYNTNEQIIDEDQIIGKEQSTVNKQKSTKQLNLQDKLIEELKEKFNDSYVIDQLS